MSDFAIEGTPFEYARVYIGPEQDGGHPGYRGPIIVCCYGVLIGETAEWLFIGEGPQYRTEWIAAEVPALIPWHRVHSIEPDHNQQGG